MESSTTDSVKNYYSKVLSTSKDLKTSACCSAEAIPASYREVYKLIHPTVMEKFYGCGSPFPAVLEGRTVLDLGCGSGRDVYLLSALVGETGRVIGVDMTEEQLAVAKEYQDYHQQAFGFKKSNVEFHHGYIEDLQSIGIVDNSIDLVVSNCVVNLSPDKSQVLAEIFRVLKPGGELYFSDVYADRRIPKSAQEDPVLFGECLSGALYLEDFRRILSDLGIKDFRAVSSNPIDIHDPIIRTKLANINFSSVTIRAFNLPLEDQCEDYGQVATYQGTISGSEAGFSLDDHHFFEANRPMLVCGNTADMLTESAYATHFKVTGDKQQHFGLFDCGDSLACSVDKQESSSCC